jgi:hypothetical protein
MVMERHYRIEVDGRLPAGVRDELHRRFGPVAVHDDPGHTVVCAATVDQSGLRALLGLLWDAGLRITAMTTMTGAGSPAP